MQLCLLQERFITYYRVFVGIFLINNCQTLSNKLSKCQTHFFNDYCHKSNELHSVVAERLNQIKIFIDFPAFYWKPNTFHTAISINNLRGETHIISNEDPLRRFKTFTQPPKYLAQHILASLKLLLSLLWFLLLCYYVRLLYFVICSTLPQTCSGTKMDFWDDQGNGEPIIWEDRMKSLACLTWQNKSC